jgi:BolA protein
VITSPQNAARIARIRALLEQRFHPSVLEVIDDSHLHAGHAGARSGAGHFTVRIVAEGFAGQSRLQSHRLIYDTLADMMPADIHALAIHAVAIEQKSS